MWHTLHSYAMLSDVTNKGLRLETARKWFDRVMYQVSDMYMLYWTKYTDRNCVGRTQ